MSEGKAAGRTQLKGLLDNLVQKSIEEREENVSVDVEEAAKDLMELNEEGGKTRKRKASRLPAKRRKKRKRKDVVGNGRKLTPESVELRDYNTRHIPHVMTLFDRKVDLARFSPDTSLYVMCREWMSNNPDMSHPPHPTLNHTTPHISLPSPTPLPTDKEGREVRIDVPKPHPRLSTGMADMDRHIDKAMSESAGDLNEYKKDHVRRWREVRARWKIASAQNQLRYESSLKILRGMFRRL